VSNLGIPLFFPELHGAISSADLTFGDGTPIQYACLGVHPRSSTHHCREYKELERPVA
jgi:hypothetical protein